jgi:hypothetical protein
LWDVLGVDAAPGCARYSVPHPVEPMRWRSRWLRLNNRLGAARLGAVPVEGRRGSVQEEPPWRHRALLSWGGKNWLRATCCHRRRGAEASRSPPSRRRRWSGRSGWTRLCTPSSTGGICSVSSPSTPSSWSTGRSGRSCDDPLVTRPARCPAIQARSPPRSTLVWESVTSCLAPRPRGAWGEAGTTDDQRQRRREVQRVVGSNWAVLLWTLADDALL